MIINQEVYEYEYSWRSHIGRLMRYVQIEQWEVWPIREIHAVLLQELTRSFERVHNNHPRSWCSYTNNIAYILRARRINSHQSLVSRVYVLYRSPYSFPHSAYVLYGSFVGISRA